MKRITLYLLIFACSVLLPLEPESLCFAQEANQQTDVSSLVKKLKSKDEEVQFNASKALISMGPNAIPTLVEVLNKEKGCQMQFIVSGIIYRIEPKHEIVNATLLDIIRGKCKGSSTEDLITRRQAAFALVAKAEGIAIIAEMLKDKETFIRRSAAFAIDELTERIGGRPPEVRVTPEISKAIKAALPLLIQAFNDKDEIVRCMSYESMEQLQSTKHEEL
jgi:HEAT repeat protein